MASSADDKHTLLIVEDDPVAQKILASVAEGAGYVVILCADAESGWRYFQAETPRLVILDWLLAGKMDGVTLCRKIRASEKGRFITILMTTVQERPQDFEAALKAGVTYYMTKPIKREFFEAWLSAARKSVDDLGELEAHEAREERYRQELENLNAQMEEALSRANEMAMEAEQAYIEIKQIFKTVAGGILLIDNQYSILRYNEAFLDMAGVTAEEVKTRKCYEIFPSPLCNTPECPLQKVRKEGRCESEIEAMGADGGAVHYRIISTPFRGPAGDFIGVVEHIADVTARVKAEKALQESEQRYKELSIVDELTGLYNKRHFNHHLELETERARRYKLPLSLLLLDIDNFKQHNDTYGHADGDHVLARLGTIIVESIRLNDLGCRYGGEEFTVILPNTSGKDAMVVAERIRTRFSEEAFVPTPDRVVRKTVSVGIAEYRTGEQKEELLERADHHMYAAKQGGKNRVVFQ